MRSRVRLREMMRERRDLVLLRVLARFRLISAISGC
jgi:hypothetical protein